MTEIEKLNEKLKKKVIVSNSSNDIKELHEKIIQQETKIKNLTDEYEEKLEKVNVSKRISIDT